MRSRIVNKMDTFWIFIAVISISCGVKALQQDVDSFPGYWQNDGDYDWYSDELEKFGIVSAENKEVADKSIEKSVTNTLKQIDNADEEIDKKVAEEIEKFRIENDDRINSENLETDDELVDYQIEDNRSEVDDDTIDDQKNEHQESDINDDDLSEMDDLRAEIADLNRIKQSLDDSKERSTDKIENATTFTKEPLSSSKLFDVDTEDIANSNDKKNYTAEIFLETQKILNEDESDNDSLGLISVPAYNQSNLNETVEEAKKILDSTDDELGDSESIKSIKKLENLDIDDIMNMKEEDLKSYQEAYDDVLEHWDKLSENWDEKMSPTDEEKELDEVYKKVIDLDKDYETISDDDLEELFAHDKLSNKNITELSLEEVEPFPDDTRSVEEKAPQPKPIEYLHDALEPSDSPKEPDAEMIDTVKSTKTDVHLEETEGTTESSKTNYDHLTNSEYDKAMNEFKSQHREEFDFKSADFDKHVAPIHITIGEEPVIVTSPNYPNNYPTNNIIDWIFYGEGEGIELNITDFAVNGHLGDYLLVKPGGVDASGNDGLIFSYTLNSERRYRFLDVNRMFVRFEAKPGMQFMKGFSFSVKILRQIPYEPEPEPTPEPISPPPHSTLTLNLGGITLEEFVHREVEEEFLKIVSDMATMYINANNIDPGVRPTLEVAQIVSTALCFHNWPKFESCVEIKFGIPLEYEGDHEPRLNAEDLSAMWDQYFGLDPFAARLRRLGITEYQVPNDNGVLTVWLVIAAGVIISVAMLAFALWRFSCFEDYSRMPPYGDTDSIPEKRNFDLYPTPHQTLPPLYAEHEYKWSDGKYEDSTRVDIGGYANKNYLRDDLYDLDSDDDIAAARESNKRITPSDIYV
ncbi:interaptin-like [Battus philenor]|uniref:interaptin-like n=1 Tax=Battus philenor TaxID=42288 RepID=UPI0035D03BB5